MITPRVKEDLNCIVCNFTDYYSNSLLEKGDINLLNLNAIYNNSEFHELTIKMDYKQKKAITLELKKLLSISTKKYLIDILNKEKKEARENNEKIYCVFSVEYTVTNYKYKLEYLIESQNEINPFNVLKHNNIIIESKINYYVVELQDMDLDIWLQYSAADKYSVFEVY